MRLDAPGVFRGYLRALANKPIEVIVRVKRSQRSRRQNSWYWGCIIPMLAEHCGYTPDEMHELMAMKFLRIEDCPVTGSPRRQRTPKTNTAEFAEYCEQIRIFAATELGVVIPDPQQVETRAA